MNPTPPPPTPAPLYTAAQLARALGLTKRAVRIALAAVWPDGKRRAPAGTITFRGQTAHAWTLDDLPNLLRVRLMAIAAAQHFPDAETMLRQQVRAARFVPAAPASPAPAAASRDLHADLADWLTDYGFYRRTDLARKDREDVWAEISRHHKALAAVTPEAERPALKSSLVTFLLSAVAGIVKQDGSSPLRALARSLDRKLAAFEKGGRAALRDGRETRSGNWRPPLCPACWKKVIDAAILHECNESLAWRQLKRNRRLCSACQHKHVADDIPASVRTAVTPLTESASHWGKSDAAGRAAGPYIPRDWEDTAPGDYFVADDVTWNHLCFDYDAYGQPYFFRPECLYIADERTSYPLGFLLIGGHYNGRHVRRLLLKSHDDFGLPHVGFKFENGIWRSRTVRDESCPDWISFSETQDGFQSLPDLFRIRHFKPRNPRAKVIEGDFRILQARMAREIGYVGRNERETKSDAIKDFERRARQGKEAPQENAWHISDFAKLLRAIFDEFANEPRNGARLAGVSAADAWRAGMLTKPLRKLPDELRYILATSRTFKKVTAAGLQLRFGKNETWTYAGERLGAFIGKHVIVHYHFDLPELVTVFDCKRSMKPFSVKGIRLPANTATREQMAEAHREIGAFNRTPKTIAGNIANPFANTITRDNDFSPAQREAGRQIEADKAEHIKSERHKRSARDRQVNKGIAMMREHLMSPESPAAQEEST